MVLRAHLLILRCSKLSEKCFGWLPHFFHAQQLLRRSDVARGIPSPPRRSPCAGKDGASPGSRGAAMEPVSDKFRTRPLDYLEPSEVRALREYAVQIPG